MVDDPETNAKIRLGPPGVDTELFAPSEDGAGPLRRLAANLRAATEEAEGGSWDRDTQAAADAVEWFAEAPGPRVVFVGKLIVSKGVDLLLAAWPLVHAANPEARLLVVGFGEAEQAMIDAWAGLERGDLAPLRDIAVRGRGVEGGEEAPLAILSAFLEGVQPGYLDLARDAAGSVAFSGRLEHDEVGELVPASDALVFPSTFPEAFGMVAAEAASAGALPVSAAHSGAAEVSAALGEGIPGAAAPLLSFPVDDRAVSAIADRLNAWLALPEADGARRPRGPARDGGRALELGGSRQEHACRGRRRPRGAARAWSGLVTPGASARRCAEGVASINRIAPGDPRNATSASSPR